MKGTRKAHTKTSGRPIRWVAVSGGFDPLHIGHIRMFKEAHALGDKLVVILNNDNWLKLKKGFTFMPQKERKEIIESFPFVDKVVLTDHTKADTDMSICRTLEKVRPSVFVNGGDRTKKNIPEFALCKKLGIEMAFNVGKGGKVQSSSWMIRDVARLFKRSMRPWGEFYDWDDSSGWHLKTVYVRPGKRLSLQYHHNRSELWVLVEGDAIATIGERKHVLKRGELFSVPVKAVHRLESKKGGVIVEIALGDFDESDIIRLEDDHGRT